jgi:phage terminase large subunit
VISVGPSSTYKPTKIQDKFHRDPARFKIILGGRRSGKTRACAAEIRNEAMRRLMRRGNAAEADGVRLGDKLVRPAVHIWVLAPTYKLLAEPFRALAQVCGSELIDEWRGDSNPPHVWLKGGVLIEGYGSDRSERLVGVGLHAIWVDEAAQVRPQVWQEKIRPTLAEHRGNAVFSSTPEGANWFYDLWKKGQDGQDPAYSSFHWKSIENPYVPREEIEQARRDMPPRYFRRMFEASPEAFEGQIYERFDHARHVFTGPVDLARYRRVVCGVDFGFATRGAVVVCGFTPDGAVDVVAEEVASGRLDEQWRERISELRQRWRIQIAYCDPAGSEQTNAMKQVIPALPATNAVSAGINKVAMLLHQTRTTVDQTPKLRVHSSCKNLVETFPKYHWDATLKHGVMERPAPNQDDHALDALRYAIYSESKPAAVRAIR